MRKNKSNPDEQNLNLSQEEIALRAQQRKRAERKKRKKMIKTGVILLALVIIAVIVLMKFISIKKAEEQAESLTTYTVSARSIEQVLSATGTLMPVDSYTVSANVKGDILSAPFEEGDEVKKDDILYVIDSSEMDNTLRQREISVENALDSYNELLEDREKLRTYSKYSGIITKLYVEVGDTVREDQVIADVIDKNNMLIDLPFFEVDALQMKKGDSMLLAITGSGEQIYGSVQKISAVSGISSTGVMTRNVTIKVSNPGGITNQMTASGEYTPDMTSTDSGTFYYNVEEQILAAYSGDILSLNVEEGSFVDAGSLVLVLDGHDLEKSIKNASQSLENAQISYDNTVENIEDYTIRAPITGTVVEKSYNAGESIDVTSGSKTAAIIYDLSALTFDMNIDELDIRSIQKGQRVTVTSDAYSGMKFYGEITKISKVGSTSSGTTVYPVTVTISDKEALDVLLPGMNIDAEIIINRVEDVIAVPTGAVSRGNVVKVIKNPEKIKTNENNAGSEMAGAFPEKTGDSLQNPEKPNIPSGNMNVQSYGTVPGDTEFETVRVETGISDDDFIEIVSGLELGDMVIVEKQQISTGFFGMMGGMSGMPGGMSGGMPQGAMGGGTRMPGGR